MSVVFIVLAAVCAAWVLSALVVAYARLANMHDAPGARRMHTQPTVRGAGLGFVLTIVAAWAAFGYVLGPTVPLGRWALATTMALAMVALVSWIDDRRGLPVLPRLAVHVFAALLVAASVALPPTAGWMSVLLGSAALWLVLPGINFWNFLDGINGIAATQAIAMALGLSFALYLQGEVPAAWFAAIVGGAVLGFLPFNFPRPQAFMGDVGSASLGLLCTALALLPLSDGGNSLLTALPLVSAVFLDAGLTLLWRMSRRPRRRWYTAHREHSYQWLARSGWGHTRTTLVYLAWTVGPAYAVVWIGQVRPELKLIATITLYLVGAVLWRLARDHALARARVRA